VIVSAGCASAKSGAPASIAEIISINFTA